MLFFAPLWRRGGARLCRRGGAPLARIVEWIAGLPVARAIAVWTYRRLARRRALAQRVDRWLGFPIRSSRTAVVRWLYLRGLGLVYLVAFTSLRSQVLGLYGSRGITPVRDLLDRARRELGRERYRVVPSVLWIDASDETLVRLCRTGQLLSLALVLNVAPRIAAALLWAVYLSFVSVGGAFLAFQWDALLLESGLLGIVVAPGGLRPRLGREPAWPSVCMMRWLAFRLSFESGIAKLRSGDPTWRSLSACLYHYETQPLPTPLGWYAHQLPRQAQRMSTLIVLAGECLVPLFAFGPRRVRRLSFWLLSALQAAIAATGNYGFFNMLTFVNELWLLDDEALAALPMAVVPARASVARQLAAGLVALPIFAVSGSRLVSRLGGPRPPQPLRRVARALGRIQAVNPYGLFSVMTTRRPEIALEGSDDGLTWKEYAFRYKPGDVRRAPRWVAPYHPRLDWQMWFAALEAPPPWFLGLLARLLEGAPDVLGLLDDAPWPAERPPRYVRAVLYEYTMADLATHRETGAWWHRERIGLYFPAVCLHSPAAA